MRKYPKIIDQECREFRHSGERALIVAVMERAIRDCLKVDTFCRPIDQREAMAWVFDKPDWEQGYTCEYICDALDLDIWGLRNQILLALAGIIEINIEGIRGKNRGLIQLLQVSKK